MERDEVVARYRALVSRCPSMTNAEIARDLGMRERSLEQALTRARRAGLLDVRRRSVFTPDGARVEVLPKRS